VVILVGLSVISPVQYVVMICACVHCRMKFAVAFVCLLMLNILVSVCGNRSLSQYLQCSRESKTYFCQALAFENYEFGAGISIS